jgi:CheY-like chemotaxis protein
VSRARVLLAGSSGGLLRGAAAILEGSGFEAVVVEDAEILDSFAGPRPPELVVVDEAFGPRGGVEICRRVRSNPNWKPVAIILVVAAGEQNLQECEIAGINDLLLSPFPAKELVAKASRLTDVAERRDVHLPVIVGPGPADEEAGGVILNLSPSGLLLETSAGLKIGATARLSFALPGHREPVRCAALVVRKAPGHEGMPAGYGLKFLVLQGADAARIDAWVRADEAARGH